MFKKMFAFFNKVIKEFNRDNCTFLAAGLSYYTAFALPPILVLIILIGGIFINQNDMESLISRQMADLLGTQAAEQIKTIIENANKPNQSNIINVIVSIVAIVFSATGAFMSLQTALNTAWEVMPDPEIKKVNFIKNFVFKRILSFGFILVIAFLLLVSLVISTILSIFGKYLDQILPNFFSSQLLLIINILINFVVTIVLFAAIFKILPDAKTYWQDTWLGGIFTAILFIIGKSMFTVYTSNSKPGSAFGAAGSLIIILLWMYYTSLILLLGAEFTQMLANYRGKSIEPKSGTVSYKKEILKNTNKES